jgi:hypothetical protein
MTKDKVVAFPQPPLDLAEVYLGYIDSEPGIDLRDPRLLAIMDAMSREDAVRTRETLLAEGETRARRARALQAWLRQRVLRRDPNVLREIAPRARAATLQIIEDFIELDGVRVARLLPIRLGLLDRLTETFDAIAELERLEGAEQAEPGERPT